MPVEQHQGCVVVVESNVSSVLKVLRVIFKSLAQSHLFQPIKAQMGT